MFLLSSHMLTLSLSSLFFNHKSLISSLLFLSLLLSFFCVFLSFALHWLTAVSVALRRNLCAQSVAVPVLWPLPLSLFYCVWPFCGHWMVSLTSLCMVSVWQGRNSISYILMCGKKVHLKIYNSCQTGNIYIYILHSERILTHFFTFCYVAAFCNNFFHLHKSTRNTP